MEAEREKKNEILRDEKARVCLRGKTAAFPPIYRLWSLKENSGNVACTRKYGHPATPQIYILVHISCDVLVVGRNYFYEPFSSEFSLRLSIDCRETEVSFSRFSIFSEPVCVCYECVSFGLLSCWMFVDSSSRGIPSEFVLSQANSPAIYGMKAVTRDHSRKQSRQVAMEFSPRNWCGWLERQC